MDDESGESMEPMRKVPLAGLGDSELGRLVYAWLHSLCVLFIETSGQNWLNGLF